MPGLQPEQPPVEGQARRPLEVRMTIHVLLVTAQHPGPSSLDGLEKSGMVDIETSQPAVEGSSFISVGSTNGRPNFQVPRFRFESLTAHPASPGCCDHRKVKTRRPEVANILRVWQSRAAARRWRLSLMRRTPARRSRVAVETFRRRYAATAHRATRPEMHVTDAEVICVRFSAHTALKSLLP